MTADDEANLDGLLLLLAALEAEGRRPQVIRRTDRRPGDLDGVDYVAVEDATWRAWCNATGYP